MQRALLLPQEVIQLPREDQIILIESQPPVKCKKIIYFKERFFMSRISKQIPIPKQEPNMVSMSKKDDKKEDNKNSSESSGGGSLN